MPDIMNLQSKNYIMTTKFSKNNSNKSNNEYYNL